MMTRRGHLRASRLAIAFWGVVLLLFSPVVLSPQTVADWDWLNENFHKALDATLPMHKNCGTCVSYRSYETLQVGDVEYSLLITQDATQSKKGYKAHIRMPDKVPLGRQLLVMHQKQQDEPVASMERDLKFKDW